MRSIIIGASLIALCTSPATASTKPASRHVAPKAAAKQSPPDFAAMLAMFDKLFPPQPDPDPARLALARTSSVALWPDGAYGKLMTGLMSSVFDRVMAMKPSDLPMRAGSKKDASARDVSLHDAAAARDPYFDQRTAAIKQVAMEEAGKISAIIDPRVRDGLARSMARRFDERQLADINAFFVTPSGRALAAQYIQMWVDPDMMRSMASSMPEMMKLMPGMMEKVKAASDKFPAPPKTAKPHAKS
ncbi:electron transfer flavoprotein alpha subunit [Sphingomonas sp. F9_3S_D5_B_2]